MKISKLNVRNDIPLNEAFSDGSLDLTTEQKEQLYKNMCEYFGVDYSISRERKGVEKIITEIRSYGK